ncbi:6-phosphofructokinase [Rosistilla carotiformis]|uniref:ATP-dependent 6-phosphofructokinase n=1 Tax=Rosistilla carotiformis TaxID=2528017 RepID=A0A518JPF0_9BACT|nr:ATP-dependent 6-phosphofructokinase [Rosistilla carotiformis]QDV67422.1 6-phosphofructokinase [Rosistilla carotiformis]
MSIPTNDSTRPRIGILTAGGDCPGLNAVIRGVVKSAYRMGFETLGFEGGFEGLVAPVRCRQLTPQNTSGILTLGGTILGSTNRGRFGVTVGIDQKLSLPQPLIDAVRQTFQEMGMQGLICVGGDGSLSIALELHRAGLPVVGVPKTIDNDLSCTAFTFGFDSAVNCATDALDRLHTTASSHDRVMVLEVMGRHAGWIALHAGIAGGADVILIPEIPWTYEGIIAKIEDRRRMGKNFTLVVVAEGAALPEGVTVAQETIQTDRQTLLGGIGAEIAERLLPQIDQEIRCVVLGHLQRGGGPTNFDRVLATQLGAHAVRLIIQRRFGEMVCYQPPQIDSVTIAEAVGELRRVPPDSSTVAAARAMGISFGDSLEYKNPFLPT